MEKLRTIPYRSYRSDCCHRIHFLPLPPELPEHYLHEWAKHCADNEIYFSFSGGGDRPTGGVNGRKLKKIKEIAGDYFVAYNLSELGSAYACKGSDYHFPYTPRPWESM